MQQRHIPITANIKESNNDVKITCEFNHPEQVCVVVYHELHGSAVLKVREYNSETQFPQVLIRDNSISTIYSIAVFGMNRKREMGPKPVERKIFPSGNI